MALQTTGPISIDDCSIELGYSSGTVMSMNDSVMRDLANVPTSGSTISLNDFYGASNLVTGTLWVLNPSYTDADGTRFTTATRISDFTSAGFVAGDTLEIASDIVISSNSTYTASLRLDVACTIINYGKILGRGQDGGGVYSTGPTQYVGQNYLYPTGRAAGTAIDVQVSGCTIINQSGAYIAGGGGGGANGYVSNTSHAGGGGGAGGGQGGRGYSVNANGGTRGDAYTITGNGQKSGTRGLGPSGTAVGGYGGSAGGGGALISTQAGGGGGGMLIAGTGGNGSANTSVGAGGSGNSAGAGVGGGISNTSGGGGGWGASGGNGQGGYNGGGGGNAIEGTSRTLTNNGTIYGAIV